MFVWCSISGVFCRSGRCAYYPEPFEKLLGSEVWPSAAVLGPTRKLAFQANCGVCYDGVLRDPSPKMEIAMM